MVQDGYESIWFCCITYVLSLGIVVENLGNEYAERRVGYGE